MVKDRLFDLKADFIFRLFGGVLGASSFYETLFRADNAEDDED